MSWRSYAQLVRLPNLPSALADIALAGLATGMIVAHWPVFLLLLITSACLYMAGMAWNDYFDLDQDRRERPERPLPSGAITPRQAALLAGGLMVAGMTLAVLAGIVLNARDESARASLPAIVVGFLIVAILLYDAWLKHTAIGPIAMGSCRFLNILLGLTLAGSLGAGGSLGAAWRLGPHLAATVGLYIVGVTWLARTEARVTSKGSLVGAVIVLVASFGLALAVPVYQEPDKASILFPFLLVALGFFLGFPLHAALTEPSTRRVQAAVRRCLMGLILFDATLATAVVGELGLVLLVLMVPSMYLNRQRWLYAT